VGLGLTLVRGGRRMTGRRAGSPRAPADLPWLALVILCSGAIALVPLIWPASLLLNLEGHATLAIAWLVFRENVDR